MGALGRYRVAVWPLIALMLVLAALLLGMERYSSHDFELIQNAYEGPVQAPYQGGAAPAQPSAPAVAVPGQATFTG